MSTQTRFRLFIAAVAVFFGGGWWVTGIWQDRAATQIYADASLQTEQFVTSSVVGYERIIATRIGMVRVLAREQTYRDALSQRVSLPNEGDEDERRRRWHADPRLTAVNRQLATTAHDLGLRSIWLMDTNGDCIAASNAGEPTDHIGTRYADRDYFQTALTDRSAYQITNGRRQLNASITFSAPVTDRNGRVIGVLAGGNDLSMFASWLNQATAFVTDRHGVVILSNDPAMTLRAMPDAPVHRFDTATREQLYKTSDIQALSLPPPGDDQFPSLIRFADGTVPAVLSSREVTDGALVLHVLKPLPQWADIQHLRPIYAVAICMLGSLSVLLAAAIALYRRQRHASLLALTESKQQAMDSSDFLNQIVNTIADPLVVKDHKCRWVLVNQAFCRFMGHPPEYFIGKTTRDVFPEHQARRLQDTDERVLASGIESICEEKLTNSHGIPRIVVIKKAPYTDMHGNHFLVGVFSDITERKQVERLLRAREREFSSLAESLPVAVIRYDAECRHRYLNPLAESVLRGRSSDLLGLLPGQGGAPASSAMFTQYRHMMEEVLATDTMHELDFVLDELPPDSHEHYDVRFVPEHDTDGKTVGVLAIWNDITERKQLENELKQREAEFRGLAENLPDPVFRYDRDGRRRYVNRAAERITGMSKDQLLGNLPTNCIAVTSEDTAKLMASIREVATTGEQRSFSVGYLNSYGESIEHQGLLVPEFDANGQVATVLTVAHDVSALRKAERHAASFFANMPGFAYTLRMSPDGHVSLPFASNGIEDIYGLRPEDVQDDATPMLAMEHPEDQPRIEAEGIKAAQTLQPFQVEFRVQRPGHPQRWIESRSVPQRQADGSVFWHGIMLDITVRKRMEEALTHSEARYRTSNSLLTSMLDSPSRMYIYALDRNYRYLAFNDQFRAAAKRAWGTDITVGMNMLEVIDTAVHREFCRKGFDHVLAGHSFTLESHETFTREGGTVHEYHDNYGSPIRNDQGDIVGLTVFAINISERKRIEVQLTEALEFSNGIINALPDMLFELDREGRYLNVWTQCPDMLAAQKAALLGRKLHDVLLPQAAELAMAALREADENGFAHVKPISIVLPDGQTRWYEHSLSKKAGHSPSEATFLALSRDVTDTLQTQRLLEEARARMEGVLQTMPDMVWLKDVNGVYQLCNHAFSRLTGVTEPDMVGKTDHDLFEPQLADFFRQQDLNAIEAGTVRVNEEWVTYADNGYRALLETRKLPMYGADGKLSGVLGIARDITDTVRSTASSS